MKIISLEEHYRLPAIEELAKPDDPYNQMEKNDLFENKVTLL